MSPDTAMGFRLKPEELRAFCDPATLPFVSTAELPPLEGVIGQERAVEATSFGVGMRPAGYNLFVLGPARTGKTSTMRRILARTAKDEAPPFDYCYVHNFQDSYRPTALALPAGRGRALVDECKSGLQLAFESEEFERQKSQILEQLSHGQQAEIERFEAAARAEKFAVIRGPSGWAVAPAQWGQVLLRLRRAAGRLRHAGRSVRGGHADPDREDPRVPARPHGPRVVAAADGLLSRTADCRGYHRRGRRQAHQGHRFAGGGGRSDHRRRHAPVRAHVRPGAQAALVPGRIGGTRWSRPYGTTG